MKGVCFESVGQVACRDLAEPSVQSSRDAVVEVSIAGLCGSDLHPFFGREVGLDPGTVMGHELVGRLVELGDQVKTSGWSEGDRVSIPFSSNCGDCFYCNQGLTSRCTQGQLFGWLQDGAGLDGCQSRFVRIPLADATLSRVPDTVSDVAALLLGDNYSTGYFCAEMGEIKSEAVYVVIGCGTVGLMCVMSALHMKAGKVFAIDPVDSRRDQAQALGAISLAPGESALAEIRKATQGRGADSVMELVGLPEAQSFAYQAIRPGGIMSVIGCHCTPHFSFSPVDAYDKNLTYKTGRCPARSYMDRLTDLVAAGQFDLDPFVTHRFQVDECVKAYDVFSNRKDGCVKAVVDFTL